MYNTLTDGERDTINEIEADAADLAARLIRAVDDYNAALDPVYATLGPDDDQTILRQRVREATYALLDAACEWRATQPANSEDHPY